MEERRREAENIVVVETKKKKMNSNSKPIINVWDSGSSLYDSFELKSFQDTLKSAIASRTLSMPHLSNPGPPQTPPPPPPPPAAANYKSFKLFTNPFQKLFRMLFRSRQYRGINNNNNKTITTASRFKMQDQIYKSSGSDLSSNSSSSRSSVFSQVHDRDQDQTAGNLVGGTGFSPEMTPLVGRRSVSERFNYAPRPRGISCA